MSAPHSIKHLSRPDLSRRDNFRSLMDMKLEYILFGFGILFYLAGVGYLAAEYVKYLSEAGKLVSLLLMVGMFASLGKHFEGLRW